MTGRRAVLAGLVFVAAAAGACDEQTTRPPGPRESDAGFFPLAVGVSREYRATRAVRFLAADGSDLRTPTFQTASVARAMVARERIAGFDWFVEEERFALEGSPDASVSWLRYREDPSGLYRADISAGVPPGAAGVIDTLSESRRFAYPRDVGAAWRLRERDPGATATIVAREELSTALGTVTAFVVSLRLANMGSADRRMFWFSSCGIVRSEVHTEVNAIDFETGVEVRVVVDETTELTGGQPSCGRPGRRRLEATPR